MKHSLILKILIVVIVLILLWAGTVAVDYYRATQRRTPLFTYRTYFRTDGGTRTFRGLGYRITFYNQFIVMPDELRTDIVFQFFGFERTFPGIDE